MNTQLEHVFRESFYGGYRTVLLGGSVEPLYMPAGDPCEPHHIYYREDFFASALHEVAHWCIAGAERRQREDYGYWYAPDGRGRRRQKAFEQVEVKPQAIEWYFALACGSPFRVSADNLSTVNGPAAGFLHAVLEQARRYCVEPLPPRAGQFRLALAAHFSGP